MKFSVSNSCYVADSFFNLGKLPADFGIEIQIEFGTEFYWKTNLAKVMKDRTGGLSIHGQFVDIDLSADDLDENEVFDYYRWAFGMYKKYNAEHFTIHPDGKLTAPATEEEIAHRRENAIRRIQKLADIAEQEGVHLLVENLRPKGYGMIFDCDSFIELFDRIKNVDCLIDTGHMYLSGWDFTKVLSSLNDKIKAYHINDNSGVDDDHWPVGKGYIQWGRFFEDYKKYTPDAEMVLEYKGVTVPQIVASARLICDLLK